MINEPIYIETLLFLYIPKEAIKKFNLVFIKTSSSNTTATFYKTKTKHKHKSKMNFILLIIAMIAFVAMKAEATISDEGGIGNAVADKEVDGQMMSKLGWIRGGGNGDDSASRGLRPAPVRKRIPYVPDWCKGQCYDDDNLSGLDKWKLANPGKPLPPKFTRPRRTRAPRRRRM
jgi:hypothetical protein